MNEQQYSIEAQTIIKAIAEITAAYANASGVILTHDVLQRYWDFFSKNLNQYIEDNKKKEEMK